MTHYKVEKQIGGRILSIETGTLAKQADGAVVVRHGDSVVLVTAQSAKAREGIDFFPLTVEYRERMSAGGKFPGGFIKREGRPSERDILTMRQIDRPIRPLFPEGYRQDLQIIGTLLSADPQNDPDVLALCGASAALSISTIPFQGPIAAVRVGLIDDEFVINPTTDEREKSQLDLIVAGSRDAVVMVEAGAKMISEEDIVDAIQFGHEAIREIVEMIDELVKKCGKEKQEFTPPKLDAALVKRMKKFDTKLRKALQTDGKLARYAAIDALRDDAIAAECKGIKDEDELKAATKEAKKAFSELSWRAERDLILAKGIRADGRKSDEIRDISIDLGLLPRTHGSAVFTRGETQALVTTALGTGDAEQRVENVMQNFKKRFYLDYNFPPFSVGECRPIRGPGRREIGHGALAERAVSAVMPEPEDFSYTVRSVSDILESNGSSSMATVCGSILSMMDAGVPIKAPVAGVAMGLVMDGDRYKILSDIAGSEDHNGDMDFKVAGTREGITALQMDIKVGGLTVELLTEALEQAKKGRLHILDKMVEAISTPRSEVSPYAPRLDRVKIPVEKIGILIGPGGRQIKAIQEETGANIEVNDDGVVLVSGPSGEIVAKAVTLVRAVTAEVEVGQIFDGKVISIKDFGAFVEIAPGQEGLCHVSELDTEFVRDVTDVVKLGDVVQVKVIHVDPTGRIKLSRKAAMAGGEGNGAAASEAPPSRGRDDERPAGGRGDRDGGPSRGRGPRDGGDDRPPRGRGRDDGPRGRGRDDAPRGRGRDDDRGPRPDRDSHDDRPPRGRGPGPDRDRAESDDRDAPRGRGRFGGPRDGGGRDRDDRPAGRGRDDDRPPRGRGRDDDRPPRGRGRDDDRPLRGRGRDDERPPAGRGRDDDRPPRGRGRDDERPPRGRSAEDDRPPRGRGRDDERPPRGRSAEDDRPPRGRGRDDERPPRGRSAEDDRPPRGRGGDDDRPPRGRGGDGDRGGERGDSGADRGEREGGGDDRPRRPRGGRRRR